MKTDPNVHAILGLRIPREIEVGLKAIAEREGESMATIVRASLRNTIARASAGAMLPLGVEAQPQHFERERAVA
jgi:hypothetical protein